MRGGEVDHPARPWIPGLGAGCPNPSKAGKNPGKRETKANKRKQHKSNTKEKEKPNDKNKAFYPGSGIAGNSLYSFSLSQIVYNLKQYKPYKKICEIT